MSELFKAKVRQMGSSAGVLIPQEALIDAGVGVGDEVEIAILLHRKDFSGFGMFKQVKGEFIRDKNTRNFS